MLMLIFTIVPVLVICFFFYNILSLLWQTHFWFWFWFWWPPWHQQRIRVLWLCKYPCIWVGGGLTAVHRLRLRFSWSSSSSVCVFHYCAICLQLMSVQSIKVYFCIWSACVDILDGNSQSISFIMSKSPQRCVITAVVVRLRLHYC